MSALIAIGSVLLAGGAAFFLLQMAGSLLSDSQSIVGEASNPTSGKFEVGDAFLQVDEVGRSVLNEYVGLGPGAKPLNLSLTEIHIVVGNQSASFPPPGSNGSFEALPARDQDGSFEAPHYIMDVRDLIQIRLDLASAGIHLSGGEEILQTQHGMDGSVLARHEFKVPRSLSPSSLHPLVVNSA